MIRKTHVEIRNFNSKFVKFDCLRISGDIGRAELYEVVGVSLNPNLLKLISSNCSANLVVIVSEKQPQDSPEITKNVINRMNVKACFKLVT